MRPFVQGDTFEIDRATTPALHGLARTKVKHLWLRDKVQRAPGLADVLASKALWGSVVRATPLPNLSVITAGRSDENPAEVLARGTGFGDLLARLRGHFDRIIVDTAPAAAVTDATLMAPFADACGSSSRGAFRRTPPGPR